MKLEYSKDYDSYNLCLDQGNQSVVAQAYRDVLADLDRNDRNDLRQHLLPEFVMLATIDDEEYADYYDVVVKDDDLRELKAALRLSQDLQNIIGVSIGRNAVANVVDFRPLHLANEIAMNQMFAEVERKFSQSPNLSAH